MTSAKRPGLRPVLANAGYRRPKTDAKDAAIIADTLRMRRDFRPVKAPAERASELGLLTGYRRDLVADRVRMVNRLRELLAGMCPALERQFQYRRRPGLVLLSGYQMPSSLRRIGVRRLAAWLARRGVRNPDSIAARAVQAAEAARGHPLRLSVGQRGRLLLRRQES